MNDEGRKPTGIKDTGSYRGSGKQSHYVLIVLCIIYVSDYATRFLVSSMKGIIMADLQISYAQAGWLIGIVTLFIAIFAIPASVLIDRWSRRKMVAIMVFLWSLATLACGMAQSFTQLLIARAFLGIGEAGYAPAGSALLSATYPEEKRARIMGIWNAFIPLGVGVAMVSGGLIAVNRGWRQAFFYMAIPGMILAVLAWFMPDYKSVKKDALAPPGADEKNFLTPAKDILLSFIEDASSLLRIRSLLFTYLAFAMNVSITTAIMDILPKYFEHTGLAEEGKGGIFSMPILALVLIGAPLGGFLSDAWMKRRQNARMIFPAISSFAAAVALFVAFLLPGAWIQIPLLVAYGIFVTCFIAPAVSVTQDVVHPGLRALSYALCVVLQHLLGDAWSPQLVGKLSDLIGLEKALLTIPVYGLFAALFFFIGSKYYVRDLAGVEKVALEAE
ncbi:spinster family MFS transporter [Thermodesulfobacteriota bacterium]